MPVSSACEWQGYDHLLSSRPRIRPDLGTAPSSSGVRYRGAPDNTGILQLSGGVVGHIGDTTNRAVPPSSTMTRAGELHRTQSVRFDFR